MKITKGQTALIVIVIAAVILLGIVVAFVKTHPIYAALLTLGAVAVGIGVYMYKRNKGK